MVHLSKSKYTGLWQCPKMAWLRKYKPEEAVIDEMVLDRMRAGNEVGDLAMGLFGDYVEVTAYNGEKLDLSKMIENTAAEMAKGTENICEASFSYNGLYCAVDILRKENDGWAIYEVKSSTKHQDDEGSGNVTKEVYIADISYQKYVLEHCGVNVTGTYLVCLNGDYVYDGTLDITQLFFITDVSTEVFLESRKTEPNLAIAEQVLMSDIEPDIDLGVYCKKPYQCAFWKYCSKHIPQESVFNLYRLRKTKMFEYYRNGWITYRDLIDNAPIKNPTQLRQIEFALEDKQFIGDISYLIRSDAPEYSVTEAGEYIERELLSKIP